jgi:hypothetical protein
MRLRVSMGDFKEGKTKHKQDGRKKMVLKKQKE